MKKLLLLAFLLFCLYQGSAQTKYRLLIDDNAFIAVDTTAADTVVYWPKSKAWLDVQTNKPRVRFVDADDRRHILLDFQTDTMFVNSSNTLLNRDDLISWCAENLGFNPAGSSASSTAKGAATTVNTSDGSSDFQATNMVVEDSGSDVVVNTATGTGTIFLNGLSLSPTLSIFTQPVRLSTVLGDGTPTALQVDASGNVSANSDFIPSDPTGITGATAITNIVQISQANYDAIGTPDANTLYIIND